MNEITLVEKLSATEFLTIPTIFERLTIEELLQSGLIDNLIKTYQQVFGDPDIWGEGAICDRCGNIVSLPEFEKSQQCECGGKLQAYYPDEELKERIVKELTPSSTKKPVRAVMKGDKENPIGGFAWGVVTKLPNIKERILNARYRNNPDEGLEEIEKLSHSLLRVIKAEKLTLTDTEILFGDELGVLSRLRKGVAPIVYLTRLLLEHGAECGCKRFLFWTSSKSPIYQLSRFMGFEDLHQTKDGIMFLYNPDFSPVLKLFQSKSPREIAFIAAKAAKRKI